MHAIEIESEFSGSDFGDERRNRRLVKMALAVSKAPAGSFPTLLNEAELEAAYRFFNSDEVSAQKVLEPHFRATCNRVAAAKTVIVAHDNTTLSYRADGLRRGLGKSARGSGQEFLAQVALAMDTEGFPLGVVASDFFLRQNIDGRWRNVIEQSVARTRNENALHVMDREADDYELFSYLRQSSSRFIVRLTHNRVLDGESTPIKLREALEAEPVVATRRVLVSSRNDGARGSKTRRVHPARSERTAELSISARPVRWLRSKQSAAAELAQLEVNVVRVWEAHPPAGEAAIEWILATSEPIDTPAQLERIIDGYRARWVIEEFFKALKTGCAYEERQAESFDTLQNVLAFFLPIAWHILALRSASRSRPDAGYATLLADDELFVLRQEGRVKLPERPTVQEVCLAIAALGGHLKRNGPPGWLTLARGRETLATLTTGYRAALRSLNM